MSKVQAKRDEIRQKAIIGRVLKVFQDDPDHNFSPEELKQALEKEGPIESAMILKFLRHFITNGNIRHVQLEDGRNRYRYVPDDLWDVFSGLNEEHHKLYALIEESGQRGIWRGDLKKRANIDEKQMVGLIKQLKDRQLIKEVTSVTDKKKTYFLYNVDPSNDVTGGIWFSDSTFNSELVDQIIPHVVSFVTQSPGITVRELRKKVKASGVSNLPCGDDEAEQLVSAAISSGRIYKKRETLRPGSLHPANCPIGRTPCKGCPLYEVCEPKGAYDPIDCVYLQKMTETF
ncbi:RNA polymerase Rpc34 subunit family protein [Tritrichomonas foetus]|uniref:RNA polymerase Rpc34 subunit family protein n=1 Tax=Tritrichomonas foetus TaxID=1144522 RepID=A0A1J4JUH1_9EUKA|nr:RNA polymerase Rpc34 subunit family protein [Tritrichomonas foetus]|eukprot:OHT01166.1 RNA polymerase Rpc34 subunit family protein [Tritrichomonas foetus]